MILLNTGVPTGHCERARRVPRRHGCGPARHGRASCRLHVHPGGARQGREERGQVYLGDIDIHIYFVIFENCYYSD